jgi:RNA polymerase sigma-70 factor (ECF subfamily)
MEAFPEPRLVPLIPPRAPSLLRARRPARTGAHPVSDREPRTAALVRRARAGDKSAFGELYADHAPMVHAVLIGMIAVREAGDLVQDVFAAALDRLDQLDDPARFGAWIAAIARNRARDLLRAPRRRAEQAGLEAGFEARAEPEPPSGPAADCADEAARALAALRALPEAYRETLAMRLVEGLTGREIAARAGLTYGSVRVNLCRGMKLLRAELEGAGAHPDAGGGGTRR